MESVSRRRRIAAPASVVRENVRDVQPFIEAAGFDEVTVEDTRFRIANSVGLLTIELTLQLLDTEDTLAYEQVDSIFETMVTRYNVDSDGEGTLVTATTGFSLDVDVVGSILDGTIIARQRRKELDAQFDYLEAVTAE